MSNELKPSATIPGGPQNVAITEGTSANTTVQAPTSSGTIWFSFSIGSGSFTLNVNFNGQNFPNVAPGQYQLQGLTTPLGLTVQGSGSTKLAWIAN